MLKIIWYSEIRKYNVSNCTCKIPTYQTLIRVKYKAPKNATYFQFWYLCAKHQCFSTWKILLLKNHYIVIQFNLIIPKISEKHIENRSEKHGFYSPNCNSKLVFRSKLYCRKIYIYFSHKITTFQNWIVKQWINTTNIMFNNNHSNFMYKTNLRFDSKPHFQKWISIVVKHKRKCGCWLLL